VGQLVGHVTGVVIRVRSEVVCGRWRWKGKGRGERWGGRGQVKWSGVGGQYHEIVEDGLLMYLMYLRNRHSQICSN